MLHALLHHKLDETTPEPQRLEDALTSTIIGTLVLLDAGDVLADWLARARRIDGGRSPVDAQRIKGVWFWPQLALAEPDVVLRLGDQLFIIEAKYRADRHDAPRNVGDDGGNIADQLHRQWASLDDDQVESSRCPQDLRAAIRECRPVLIFLIDRRRSRRAQQQFRESGGRLPPHADLRLLTWQSLDEVLSSRERPGAHAYWWLAMREYLERTGLYAFTGLAQCLAPPCCDLRPLRQWGGPRATATILHFLEAFPLPTGALDTITSWRAPGAAVASSGLMRLARELSADGVGILRPARAFQIADQPHGIRLHETVLPLTGDGRVVKLCPLAAFHLDNTGDRR